MIELPTLKLVWECPECESKVFLEKSQNLSGGLATRWISSDNPQAGQCEHEGKPTVKRLVKLVMNA